MSRHLLFVCAALVCAFFGNCKKETKTETVIVKDTVYVRDTTYIPALISDTTTTLILLRHAEQGSGADPGLTTDGQQRADELMRILGNVPINAVYSTPFNRTTQTVQPLADARGLTVLHYDVATPFSVLLDNIIAENRGKTAVIAGHSNTVPEMLQTLSSGKFSVAISEAQYDNLFIVSLPDSLTPVITHLKYGKATP